jgi:hypothetical protein
MYTPAGKIPDHVNGTLLDHRTPTKKGWTWSISDGTRLNEWMDVNFPDEKMEKTSQKKMKYSMRGYKTLNIPTFRFWLEEE